MKYIHVMLEGEEWKFPASIVAANRAKYYAENDCQTTYDETYEEEYKFTLSEDGEGELLDWMINNMNWCDVAKSAEQWKEREDIDYQKAWANSSESWVVGES